MRPADQCNLVTLVAAVTYEQLSVVLESPFLAALNSGSNIAASQPQIRGSAGGCRLGHALSLGRKAFLDVDLLKSLREEIFKKKVQFFRENTTKIWILGKFELQLKMN